MIRPLISKVRYVAGADTGEGKRSRLISATWKTLSALLGLLIVNYLVYGNVHILFDRAENSWIATDVEGGVPAILDRVRYAFSTSYNGHYIPLFFCFQLICHSLFGIHEWLWRLCQLTVVACLTLAFLSLWDQVAEQITSDRTTRYWIKAGLAAPFVFSPLMIDFIGWPWACAQLLWATFTLLCLSWIGRAIKNSMDGNVSIRDLGVSLAFGYASINCLGLGAATLAGWCTVWALLVLDASLRKAASSYLAKLGVVGVVGLALTVMHGSLMILLLPKAAPAASHAPLSLQSFVTQTLGFASNLLVGCLRSSLWSPDGWPFPRGDILSQDWVYGLSTLLLLSCCGIFWFAAHRARPSSAGLCRVAWQTFSLVAFVLSVFMEGLRVAKGEGTWEPFLYGPRYVWPSALLMVGFIASFLSLLRIQDARLIIVLSLLVVASCISGNLVYQIGLPNLWPSSTLSHEQTWDDLAAMTSELSQAGMPLPNLPLEEMCGEFNPSLNRYELLLRSLAHINARAHVDWLEPDKMTPALWEDMKKKSPALVLLSKRVFAAEETAMRQASPEAAVSQNINGRIISLTHNALLRNGVLDHIKDHPNLGVDIDVNGVKLRSIWIDPPTSLTFRDVSLGKHPAFRSFAAIHPSVWGAGGADGAVFQVDVIVDGKSERVLETEIDPYAHPEEKTWNPVSADLSKYAGRKVDLMLSNSPGPKGNDYADWCIWGDPILVDE